MSGPGRSPGFLAALAGDASSPEAEMARICERLPAGLDPGKAWEGAILALITPGQLRSLVEARNWPALRALADLAGKDRDSWVVRSHRLEWAGRRLTGG